MFSRLKTIRPIQIVTSARLKDQHLWLYWVVIVAMAWVTCISVKAPLILKGTHRFWSNICCHQDDVQGCPCSVQQDNAKPHNTHVTKAWSRSYRDVSTRLTSLESRPPICVALWSKYDAKLFRNWNHILWKNEELMFFEKLAISASALKHWCNTMVIMPVLQFFLKKLQASNPYKFIFKKTH